MDDNYYSNKIIPFVDDLIRENAKVTKDGYQLSFQDLDQSDQNKLSSYFLELDDRDIVSISENENYDDIMSNLIKLLKDDDQDNKLDFAESVRDSVTHYYQKKMESLIKDRLLQVEIENNYEQGFVKSFDRSGEYSWRSL